MKFIIGTIILIVLNVLGLFVPFISLSKTSQGSIEGVGGFTDKSTNYRTLGDNLGGIGIIFTIFAIVVIVLFLIMYLVKQINLIPTFILYVVALINPAFSLVTIFEAIFSGSNIIGDSFFWYSESSSGGITLFGIIYIVGVVVGIAYIKKGILTLKDTINKDNKTTKVEEVKIKTNNKPVKDIKEDDFGI